jgi:hypothetical protein
MFDDIIKNKANEHEATVPPDAWDNIVKQKKKRRFGFWWWGGIAVLLFGLFTAGYFISKSSDDKTIVAESKAKPFAEEKSNATNPGVQQPGELNTGGSQVATEKVTTNSNEDGLQELANDKPDSDTKTTKGSLSVQNKSPLADEISNASSSKNEKKANNSKPLLAANNRKKKSSKGKAIYNSTAAAPEEVNTIPIASRYLSGGKKESPVAETTIEVPEQKEETKNAIVNNNEESKTPTPIDKNLPAVKEESKTATEIKKENTALVKQTKKHSWFLDAGIAPLLVSSQYDENVSFNRTLFANNNLSVYNASLIKTTIEPSVAFLLAVRRQLNKKITIGTGLQYLQLKENISIEGKETNTQYNVVNRLVNGALVADTVETVTEGTRSITAVNSYRLFSIPLFAQYSIVDKPKWSVGIVGGMYININSSYQNEIDRNATARLLASPVAENKTTTGVDVFAGLRIGKTLGKRFEFFAMPSMRWNLSKYNIKNSLLNKSLNQASVGFGISCKIN